MRSWEKSPSGATATSEVSGPVFAAGVSEQLPRDAGDRRAYGERPAGQHMIDIQRARVLAGMVEVCAELGSANVTVAHIVERAGVSRRTFYELYRDREACFLGAFDDGIARASRHVLEAYDPDAKWVVRVRQALSGLLAFFDLEPGVGQLLVVGSLGAGRAALGRRRRVVDRMIALVEEGSSEMRAGAELPPFTAEGVAGGVLSVMHGRLVDASWPSARADRDADGGEDVPDGDGDGDGGEDAPLVELLGPLMSMIVLPYLGPAAARRELGRPVPSSFAERKPTPIDPLRGVPMRLTYRTVRVLSAVAAFGERDGYPSNREVGVAADMSDQGQISKLLTRLTRLGLIENSPVGLARGAPNAWTLTPKGREIEQAIREGAMG